MEQQELHLTVNGEDHTLACDPDLPLLDVLRAGLGLAGLPAGSPVVDLNKVRQVLALPAAVCLSAFASVVDPVGEAKLEDRILRFLGNLLDAQRERMEIHQ